MGIRVGVTLIELLVVLAIMGISAAVVAVAGRGMGPADSGDHAPIGTQLLAARTRALVSGRPVTVTLADSGEVYLVTALPDGSVIAPGALHVDRFTGQQFLREGMTPSLTRAAASR